MSSPLNVLTGTERDRIMAIIDALGGHAGYKQLLINHYEQFYPALITLGRPEYIYAPQIATHNPELAAVLKLPSMRRRMSLLMLLAGYDRYSNPSHARGLWPYHGRMVSVYRQMQTATGTAIEAS